MLAVVLAGAAELHVLERRLTRVEIGEQLVGVALVRE